MQIQLVLFGVIALLSCMSATGDSNTGKTQYESEKHNLGSDSLKKDKNSKLIFNYPISLSEKILENKTADNTSDSHPELNCTNKAFDFKQMFYVVSCQKEMMKKNYTVPLKITFKSYKEALNFTLEDILKPKVASFFKIEKDDEKLFLTLKDSIPMQLLKNVSQFLFVLYVTNSTSVNPICHTTVVVNLNDEFEFPYKNITVGYPKSQDYIEKYGPPLVTSVAISERNSNNFKFRYLIRDKNCPFVVHEKTGNVYSIEYYSGIDSIHCTVLVQMLDMNSNNTKEHNLKLRVKLLKPSEIVELLLKTVIPEDFDILLAEIKEKTNMIFKILSYAVMPAHFDKMEEYCPFTRIHGYAFENENEAIADGQVIVEKLKSFHNLIHVKIISKEDEASLVEPASVSNWGLLISVVLLIIVTLLLGISVFYILFIQYRCIQYGFPCFSSSDRSTSTPLELDMEGPSQASWIDSSHPVNMFNNPNKTENINNTHQTSNYQTSDIILNKHGSSQDYCHLSGFSTFKPATHGDENILKDQSERNSTSQSSRRDVPILPVISLAPVNKIQNQNTYVAHQTDIRI